MYIYNPHRTFYKNGFLFKGGKMSRIKREDVARENLADWLRQCSKDRETSKKIDAVWGLVPSILIILILFMLILRLFNS